MTKKKLFSEFYDAFTDKVYCDDFDFDDSERIDEPKESKMVNTELDIRDQKRYYESRMWDIADIKKSEAQRFFHIIDDEPPKTAREALIRLSEGKFVLPAEEHDINGIYGIRWRDPMRLPLKEGYALACKNLEKAREDCMDNIMTGHPSGMLYAIQKFEKVTIH